MARPAADRARRSAAALAAGAVVSSVALAGCAPTAAPPADAQSTWWQIDTGTPPGLRAKQAMDMLNSDWSIGADNVAKLAAADSVDSVTAAMERLWWDRPVRLDGVDVHAGSVTLNVTTSSNVREDIDLRTDDDGLVSRFDVTALSPPISSWGDVDAVLRSTGARYSYQAAKVVAGQCEPVAGTNTAESLPLASIFKLYVLYAVAEAIRAGTLSWDDQLTLTEQAKTVGSAAFGQLPAGTPISVRAAAEQMIAASDNTATDLLIDRVGTRAVEHALRAAGHHDPGSMTPFPTMFELFSIGWGNPDVRRQWQQGSPQQRAELLAQADARPYQPDEARMFSPGSAYGVEWYGSAQDICRVHAALQSVAVGAAAPVKQIMSAVAAVDLDSTRWPYVGFKGGSLPGDLTFSWYAVDDTGQPYVVSIQLNWPTNKGTNAAGWMERTAERAFALLAGQ